MSRRPGVQKSEGRRSVEVVNAVRVVAAVRTAPPAEAY